MVRSSLQRLVVLKQRSCAFDLGDYEPCAGRHALWTSPLSTPALHVPHISRDGSEAGAYVTVLASLIG